MVKYYKIQLHYPVNQKDYHVFYAQKLECKTFPKAKKLSSGGLLARKTGEKWETWRATQWGPLNEGSIPVRII